MPVKILLADKSITIQKVVEMLFSGKEYEVLCVSDGETALSEASRVAPDVVLADIDLPRVDGYSFSGKLRETPALAQTPVILMLSRDDVFDSAKAKQASIMDHIIKPFESQELIGKVKKAVAGRAQARPAAVQAPPPAVEPEPAPAPAKPAAPAAAPPPPKPAAAAAPAPQAPPKPAPKAPAPDIFDIIEEAPSQEDVKRTVAKTEEESIYEVEPVVEVEPEIEVEPEALVEEQLPRETDKALPVGEKAVAEIREGLGLGIAEAETEQEIVTFESLDAATSAAGEYMPPQKEEPAREAREYKPPQPEPAGEAREWKPPVEAAQPALTESDIWTMAEATVSRIATEMLGKMQPSPEPAPAGMPEDRVRSLIEETVSRMLASQVKEAAPPTVSEEMVRRAVDASVARAVKDIAREVIEKVAWEVVPDLASAMIREEIERLKALQ